MYNKLKGITLQKLINRRLTSDKILHSAGELEKKEEIEYDHRDYEC